MQCPACDRALTARTAGPVTVDACDGGCGGIWFDRLELRKVDEHVEVHGEELAATVARDPEVRVDTGRRRLCPKCAHQVMMRHFFSVRRQVEVDECPRCAGMWLDGGELEAIRGMHATEQDRASEAQAAFATAFDQQLAALRAESEADAKRARGFSRMFRFLLPSWYLPGKQQGGAF